MSDYPKYYLVDGQPTDAATWQRMHLDHDYVRLYSTHVSETLWVSTVWTGIVHENAPERGFLESAVFTRKGSERPQAVDSQSYWDLETAKAGHEALVAKWRAVPT